MELTNDRIAGTRQPTLRALRGGISSKTGRTAQSALVAYLRLLSVCLEEEADLIDRQPQRATELLDRFRGELLDVALDQAPLELMLGGGAP